MTVAANIFDEVPDNGRLWVIAADRRLAPVEQSRITGFLSSFFERWQSHGRDVEGRAVILHDRFIVIGAYIRGSDVSGCGIDASVRELDEIGQAIGFGREPVLNILYHDGSQVCSVDRASFAGLANSGEVTRSATVFDTSLATVGEWKRGLFERPLAESWHADVFF